LQPSSGSSLLDASAASSLSPLSLHDALPISQPRVHAVDMGLFTGDFGTPEARFRHAALLAGDIVVGEILVRETTLHRARHHGCRLRRMPPSRASRDARRWGT